MTFTLPSWAVEVRPLQTSAVQEVIGSFNTGVSIVLLDAPTGTGKTLIADLVRQQISKRSLYVCSSISLQSQFLKDFPQAALLKGRANYPTYDSPHIFPELTAADCTKSHGASCSNCEGPQDEDTQHCQWCHPVTSCPYESAKATAIRSPLVCTNTSYFLYESNYVGTLPLTRDLIVVDEADTLEEQLLSFIQIHISAKRAEQLNISPPDKRTVESSWIEWALTAEERIKKELDACPTYTSNLQQQRQTKYIANLHADLRRLNNTVTGLPSGGWVYTGYDRGDIEFKPIDVSRFAHEYLWRHSPRWLLMSATIISFPVLMQSLGF